jgi:hypothetical protein
MKHELFATVRFLVDLPDGCRAAALSAQKPSAQSSRDGMMARHTRSMSEIGR